MAYNSSWIVYRLNRTPPLYQPLSIQNPWRDSKPISANSAETQLGLQIVVRADRDTLPIRLWIHLPAGEVCCGSHCNTQ